jgi:toxin YoeB
MKGAGKPEALKHIKAYSRRIDDANRLVYSADENQNLRIISCKGHYH